MMNALKEMIRLASAMGEISGLYGTYTCHKVVEYDLRDK